MKKTRPSREAIEAINVLKALVKEYPTQLLSTHLAIALADYPNFDGISDKQLYFILEKYRCAKKLDMDITHIEDIDEIIHDGMNLGTDDYLDEEEDF